MSSMRRPVRSCARNRTTCERGTLPRMSGMLRQPSQSCSVISPMGATSGLMTEITSSQVATSFSIEPQSVRPAARASSLVRGLRPSSVARRISSLRGLYRHLVREGAIRRDPTEHLETPRRARALPRTLSREVVAALVESPDVTAPRGVRDRAVLELLYATGMRASECLGLTLDDVNLSAGYVVCTGKGQKQRLVPVGAEAAQWVSRYLRDVRPLSTRVRDSGRLFVNPRGGRLSRQSLWTLVRRAAASTIASGVGSASASTRLRPPCLAR